MLGWIRRLAFGWAAVVVLLVVASLAAIAILLFRPALLIGVEEEALATAVAEQVKRANGDGLCLERQDGYRCWIEIGWRRQPAIYRLEMSAWGCWDATLREGRRDTRRASGCITIGDYLDQLGWGSSEEGAD